MKRKGKNNIARFFSQEKHRLLCSHLVAETAEQLSNELLQFVAEISALDHIAFETVWKFAQTTSARMALIWFPILLMTENRNICIL